jgi:hypothetical protein
MTAVRKFCVLCLLVASCKSREPDAREDLRRALNGADVSGYTFTLTEDDIQSTAAFTNLASRTVLRYTRVQDKKSGAAKTYRTELARRSIRVTDMATKAVVLEKAFTPLPQLGAICTVGEQTYPSRQACEADFDCSCRPALECEANRTCQDLFVEHDCCITGQKDCVSTFQIIRPTSRRCQLVGFLPEGGGVLAQ